MKTIVATHNAELARDFERDLLRRHDVRLVMVSSSAGLLDRLRLGADLCFVDRILPDGDAGAMLLAIRAEKALAQIPVVLVTSLGAPGVDRAQAVAAGFADVIQIPGSPGGLALLAARTLGLPLREGERFAVRVNVFEAERAAGAAEDGYLGISIDVSERGMLVRARRAFPLGTRIGVRFNLPGRANELVLGAHVVRVDQLSVSPSVGLALEFDHLTESDRGALHEYLRVLVSGRPFSWEVTQEGGRSIITLTGVLRADSDLRPLEHLSGEIRFRLRDFRRVSSESVQRWIDFVRGLRGISRIYLEECPISFIQQANLIPNLLDGQEVVTFYAPYACEGCGLEEERLIDVRGIEEGRGREPPRFVCPACKGALVFDELPDEYLAFLQR